MGNLFFFLDEAGLLHRETERFFALGTIFTPRPQDLYNPIQRLRNQHGFYDEIKWRSLSPKKDPLIKQTIDLFTHTEAKFSCLILDRSKMDYWNYFKNDFWKVYESFTSHLLRGSLPKKSSAVLLADYYSSPSGVDFESAVRERVNRYFKREALFGVCRIDSRSNDVLQLADLFLGGVLYEYKLANGLILKPSKLKMATLENMKNLLEIEDMTKKVRRKQFAVMEFKRKQ